MANIPSRFKQSDVKRAAKGALDAGLKVGRIEIDRDGRIVVMIGEPETFTEKNDWD